MFDVNSKQYILNLSTGKKAYLYYSQGNGILIRWQSEDGKWQEPAPAARNGMEGFSACLDKYNGIHVLYQDYNGNIIYMKYSEGAWNRKPILRSRNQDAGDKQQLYITCCENGVHAFYILEYNGKKYLTFQDLKDSDSPVTPKTIDQLSDFPSFKAISDNSGGISIFYTALKDGRKISGLRIYETGSLKWSGFQPFPSPHSDLTPICAAAGLSGTVHLCLQRNEKGKYCLIHCKVIPGANDWESTTLAESDETFCNTEIYTEKDCIRIFWADKTGISCRTSHDGGNNWDMEQKLDGFDEKYLSCFSYIQNTSGKVHEVRSSVIPGSFKGTPELAFLDIPSGNAFAEASEAESLRRTIAETLKLLSGSINDLRNAMRELYKRLDGLDAAQQQLELDISKYGIRDKFLENDMAKIKSELEILKTRIDDYDAIKVKLDASPGISSNSSETSRIYPDNIPLMPGTGFNSVTAGFLKGLKK
ncbi:MAG: hypothetical protein FIA99_05865 [Ruminiclostridium sp.]|nr:hypothetical protein [Ruminiclostridium sp.]